MDLCMYDDILNAIRIADKKLFHFKPSKSGQILRVDKTCFPKPGHIYILYIYRDWKQSSLSHLRIHIHNRIWLMHGIIQH